MPAGHLRPEPIVPLTDFTMATPGRSPDDQPPLRDPEFTQDPHGEGVSRTKILGVPAWAAAVGFAVLAALMYLLMLFL
jgi:hypothetical protein